MAMQWHFEDRHFAGECAIGVLQLGGYLGDDALEQLAGAVDWALAKSRGPIVIDLTHLLGCSDDGAWAIWNAACRITEDRRGGRRTVAISGLGCTGLRAVRDLHERGAPVTVHDDLTEALATLHS
jgi:UDP-N-acetylmuramoylalanine-D-glutamate ligase